MKKLESEIRTNGHIYRLLKRNEKAAVYAQYTPSGQLAGHEVFLIKVGKSKVIGNNIIPERELFPTDKAFGVWAWSTGLDPNKAFAKFDSIA